MFGLRCPPSDGVVARALAVVQDTEIALLSIDALVLGDDYRLDDDSDALSELAGSIAQFGLLQPLLVRPVKDGYEVVAGRRRLSACRSAGMEKVPCVVRALTTDQALDATLVENLHRRDLSPMEVALALGSMRDKGMTQKVIAERIGHSGFYVSVLLRLLEMPKHIQDKVHAGKLSYSTAYDHWKRDGGGKQQGSNPPRHRGSDEVSFRAISHWRRRHDRLLAGIHAVIRARPREETEVRRMLQQLLTLDRERLPEGES